MNLRDDSNQQAVTFDESRPIAAEIYVGCNDTAAIAAHDLAWSQNMLNWS